MTDSAHRTRTLNTRDLACLLWIGMQYAIRFDQLQQLLFRHTPQQDRSKLKPGADRLSVDRTYELISSWRNLGVIEDRIILAGDKKWIWLSRQGLRTADLPFTYSGEPANNRNHLAHLFFINQVRLTVETKRPDDHWTSERQIRREVPAPYKGEIREHRPDAILTNARGKRTAIEIERSAKTDKELEDNLRELAVTYKSIWFFGTSTTKRQVEKMLDNKFTEEMRKPFVLYDLADYGTYEKGDK